ncbi:cation diffusion facilitator family transporter [Vampirovibrio chlorellavorus]|uniref:cation diffusion facilitator family transporter n=1 Tax=Vampirovibrio chlorellavorus TaxID=758823 RepID=UPI0026F08982|nr:cation diffusion facilitator family transporter [Vampirovibrio chlorellavorus]
MLEVNPQGYMGTVEPPGSPRPADYSGTPTYIGPRENAFQHAESSLWVAFLVNIAVGAIKFLAWIFSQSPSMFSESLHSFGDAVNSIALILGNKFSQRPPDRSHPFGYGLEANVWALAACVFLIGTSVWAVSEGFQHFTAKYPEVMTLQGFLTSAVILVISILLEIVAVRRASQAVLEEMQITPRNELEIFTLAFANIKNVLSPTTRFVYYEDNIALLGAFLALSAISVSYFVVHSGLVVPESLALPAFLSWALMRFDAMVSMLIGGLLAGMAIYLFRHNRGILTQSSASPRVEKKITDLVTSMHGVSEILDLKTLDHGIAGLTVHLKVQVDPYIQVKDVDDLTERIKHKIQRRIVQASQVFVEVLADESEIEWGEKFNALVEQGRKEGVLDARSEILLKNVYDFSEATVKDIMIPRIDVEYVDVETPLSEVADLMIETGHSRLPVFKENVDDLVGLVHSRDVFDLIRKNQMETPLASIVREIDIFPENKGISDLLEDFKRNKIRIAAVADEHGGFAGLVTVEDVIEEIIGEIWDEHEPEEPMMTVLTPNRVQVNGKCEIEDLNEQLDLNIPFDDFKTVGGYVFGELGREPEDGDEVTFEDLKFTVKEADGPRIVSVMIESPVPFQLKREFSPESSKGNGPVNVAD